MKKFFAILLSVAMLFSLMSIGASAYTINKDDAEIGAGDIFGTTAVYFEDVSVEAGQSVTVDLMLESNPGVTEIAVTLTLPQGITIEAVENGDLGTASYEGNVVTVTSDTLLADDGCIAKITFSATGEGEKTVDLSATAESDGDEVVVSGSSCVITVIPAAVTVVEGDVDGNGERNTSDLAVLKLFLANGERNEDVVNPDVDGDGDENTSDLAALKLMLAGVA